MNKFSLRVLLVLVAVAGLTTACGKSNDAAVTADQLNNGEGVGPSLVTLTKSDGTVEVAFADQHLTSEEQVLGMIQSGQLNFVPIDQVMNSSDDDFAIQPVSKSSQLSLEVTARGQRGGGNAGRGGNVGRGGRGGRGGNVGRGRPTTRPVYGRGRRIVRRQVRHQVRRQIRRAARRSRWYANNYVWYPNNYYSSVNWVQPTYFAPSTPVYNYVNNCQQYIAYQNNCYQPVSTSLNVAWNWRLNCNYNNSMVQVYF